MSTLVTTILFSTLIIGLQWSSAVRLSRVVLEDTTRRGQAANWTKSLVTAFAGSALALLYPTVITLRDVSTMVIEPQSAYDPIYLFFAGVLAMLTVTAVDRHAMSYTLSKKFRKMLEKHITQDMSADSAADTQIREIEEEE